jgi:hypothetical protein
MDERQEEIQARQQQIERAEADVRKRNLEPGGGEGVLA